MLLPFAPYDQVLLSPRTLSVQHSSRMPASYARTPITNGGTMATNPPKGQSRKGAVRDRSQIQNPSTGKWTKRHAETGQFIDQKADGTPFKGVRKEAPPRKS